jgi:hypothetical protein
MAVVKETIKTALVGLYTNAKNSEMTESDFADGMADIIRNAILSATITVTVASVSGVTTGTGVSGSGTGTGTVS